MMDNKQERRRRIWERLGFEDAFDMALLVCAVAVAAYSAASAVYLVVAMVKLL